MQYHLLRNVQTLGHVRWLRKERCLSLRAPSSRHTVVQELTPPRWLLTHNKQINKYASFQKSWWTRWHFPCRSSSVSEPLPHNSQCSYEFPHWHVEQRPRMGRPAEAGKGSRNMMEGKRQSPGHQGASPATEGKRPAKVNRVADRPGEWANASAKGWPAAGPSLSWGIIQMQLWWARPSKWHLCL